MSKNPTFAAAGQEAEKIDVRLSYGIVRLFSEGLYASPNKAIEELVANSFDAGAKRVAVFVPADFNDQGATISVLDDGEGMDAAGLKLHWLIGKSLKRVFRKSSAKSPANWAIRYREISHIRVGKQTDAHLKESWKVLFDLDEF